MKMDAEKAFKAAEFMKEFREHAIRLAKVRVEMSELSGYINREMSMMHYDHDAVERKKADLIPEYNIARQAVALRLQEATEICDTYRMPHQLKILPAPAFGGYVHTMNVFKAFIEEDLPGGLELEPQKVIDLIDQTIYASERHGQGLEQNPPWRLAGFGRVGKGVFNFLFRTEAQKSAIGWALIALIVVGVLRLAGFNLADTIKMLFDLWKGK
jgi:hypothetical protein